MTTFSHYSLLEPLKCLPGPLTPYQRLAPHQTHLGPAQWPRRAVSGPADPTVAPSYVGYKAMQVCDLCSLPVALEGPLSPLAASNHFARVAPHQGYFGPAPVAPQGRIWPRSEPLYDGYKRI